MSDENLDLSLTIRLQDQVSTQTKKIRSELAALQKSSERLSKSVMETAVGFRSLGSALAKGNLVKNLKDISLSMPAAAKGASAFSRSMGNVTKSTDKWQKTLSSGITTFNRYNSRMAESNAEIGRHKSKINDLIRSAKDLNKEYRGFSGLRLPRMPSGGAAGGGGGRAPRRTGSGNGIFPAGTRYAISASVIDQGLDPVKRAAAAGYAFYESESDAEAGLSAKLNLPKSDPRFKRLLSSSEATTRQLGNRYSRANILSAEENLAGAGFNLNQIEQTIKPLAQAATADRGDVVAIGDSIGKAFAATGLTDKLRSGKADIADTTDLINKMARTSNAAQGKIQDVADALAQVGISARGAGDSLDTQMAVIGTLANAGFRGSQGGGAYNTLIARLSTQRDKSTKEARDLLGLDLRETTKRGRNTGKFLGTENALKEIHEAFSDPKILKKTSLAQREEALLRILGVERGPEGAALIQGLTGGGLAEMKAAVSNKDVTVESLAGLASDSSKARRESLFNSISDLGSKIFKTGEGDFKSIAGGALSMSNRAQDWVDENPGKTKAGLYGMLTALGLSAATVKTLGFAGTGSAIKNLGSGMGRTALGLGGAAKGVGSLTNPLSLLLTALTLESNAENPLGLEQGSALRKGGFRKGLASSFDSPLMSGSDYLGKLYEMSSKGDTSPIENTLSTYEQSLRKEQGLADYYKGVNPDSPDAKSSALNVEKYQSQVEILRALLEEAKTAKATPNAPIEIIVRMDADGGFRATVGNPNKDIVLSVDTGKNMSF